MGKISPVSIKYMIYASFEAVGALERPDVIGALFGQTEGLLGSDLEMRELQKEGKIGRINVELKSEGGKTIGDIMIPTSLDKAETALIAAAIETISRIGPTDAKIEVRKIEDIRSEKRGFIVDRAKKLLEQIEGGGDTREIADDLKTKSRLSKLQEYGEEKLPAGDISGREIIVVEGRADVINLLKNGINNVIAMSGTKLPEAIKQLSYDKEITLFVDGDRGGRLIAKNVYDNARVDYIVSAPDGKEVEELTDKEILIALRRKMRPREFFVNINRNDSWYRREREERVDDRFGREERTSSVAERSERKPVEAENKAEEASEIKEKIEVKSEPDAAEKSKLQEIAKQLEGTKSAYLLDENLEIIKKAPSTSLWQSITRSRKKVYAIVADCLITPNIIGAAEEKGIKLIAARNFSYTATSIKLVSL